MENVQRHEPHVGALAPTHASGEQRRRGRTSKGLKPELLGGYTLSMLATDLPLWAAFLWLSNLDVDLSLGQLAGLALAAASTLLSWRIWRRWDLIRRRWGAWRGTSTSEVHPQHSALEADDLPYSCGQAQVSTNRQLYLVGTMHISPKAPRDVTAVVDVVKPDCVLIELDVERRDRIIPDKQLDMADLQPVHVQNCSLVRETAPSQSPLERAMSNAAQNFNWPDSPSPSSPSASGSPQPRSKSPKSPKDTGNSGNSGVQNGQTATHTAAAATGGAATAMELGASPTPATSSTAPALPWAPWTVNAQRASWNGLKKGTLVRGDVVFVPSNEFGAHHFDVDLTGKVVLVRRGGPGFRTFALKAHHAEKANAIALLVVDTHTKLSPHRFGTGGGLWTNLRVAWSTRSLSVPRLPTLLLPKVSGEHILASVEQRKDREPPVQVRFEVKEDSFPVRSLPQMMCHNVAAILTGISILYGVIQCFGIEVGLEFDAGYELSLRDRIPCKCIDVDMNRLFKRLFACMVPRPENLWNALSTWLALPRAIVKGLFPPKSDVDVFGATLLHLLSLRIRTWIALSVATMAASLICGSILNSAAAASERGIEQTGAVSSEDRDDVTTFISAIVQAYALPQVYTAILVSRDEAMARNIVRQMEDLDSRKAVAIVGAMHSNGILAHIRNLLSEGN
eukprot:CAMPEP_0206540590 /NCGR_PEP_ID=MMETSP0325_2-20121206/9079_1 /ASSEMBLY_ACC=CAM_ASM_000347 /TAXON_ID=2866 /ORGANISM="Crypthecodinium cohnii, Strain Seligo" /LENGTH=678 /DNA_ID=CAMNT_0054038309 /DNA_START=324 /DNA_END=2358 /DNA_ORIENTATION=+